MKHLKLYENWFNKEKNDGNDHIRKFLRSHDIKKYNINSDGSVDINESIDMGTIFEDYYDKIIHKYVQGKIRKIPIKFGRIDGDFVISSNEIETMENSPNYIDGSFDISSNCLKTLIGGPRIVNAFYFVSNNRYLRDMYGFPENFSGKVWTNETPVDEILSLSKSDKRVKFIHLLNEYKAIRNGDSIVQDRLEEALYGIGIQNTFKVASFGTQNLIYNEFKKYKLI